MYHCLLLMYVIGFSTLHILTYDRPQIHTKRTAREHRIDMSLTSVNSSK